MTKKKAASSPEVVVHAIEQRPDQTGDYYRAHFTFQGAERHINVRESALKQKVKTKTPLQPLWQALLAALAEPAPTALAPEADTS